MHARSPDKGIISIGFNVGGPCLHDAPEAQAMAGGHGIVVGGNGDSDAQDGCHTNGGRNVQHVEVNDLQVSTARMCVSSIASRTLISSL